MYQLQLCRDHLFIQIEYYKKGINKSFINLLQLTLHYFAQRSIALVFKVCKQELHCDIIFYLHRYGNLHPAC